MVNKIAEMSPKNKARAAGVFFLLTTLAGIFAQAFVTGSLVVPTDAAATAANIMNHESFFRLGFAVYLFEMACQITMTALFYDLLKPVNKSVSLLAAFFSLTGCVVKILTRLFFIAPLLLLRDEPYLKVFDTQQTQSLALLFYNINEQGAAIALVFIGFATILKGYLIFKSTFLPRIFGVLGMIAGVLWLSFMYTPLAYSILPFILLFGLAATVLQIFWLLVYGVNEERWKEQAAAAETSIWR
ncbi:MAG: DUF4386 domain-containing protein [Pyrinomonadaceae bacterium]